VERTQPVHATVSEIKCVSRYTRASHGTYTDHTRQQYRK